jgi:hypothetical protein
MGGRANGLRGGLRLIADGLLMTKRADSPASASRVRYTSRRALLSCQNGGDFARLDNITPPLKSSQLTAHRRRRRRPSGPVPSGFGVCPRCDGVCPHRFGVCPHGANGRLAPSAQDKSLCALARFGGVCPHRGGACPRRFSHMEPRSRRGLRRGLSPWGLVGSTFHRRLKIEMSQKESE